MSFKGQHFPFDQSCLGYADAKCSSVVSRCVTALSETLSRKAKAKLSCGHHDYRSYGCHIDTMAIFSFGIYCSH